MFRPCRIRIGVSLLLPVLAGVLLASGVVPAPAAAQIYVDADAQGVGDGSSWGEAFKDLQGALAVAEGGDEIWVASGTYFPSSGADRTATFHLKSGVGIYGGFSGSETSRAERDWTLHLTTLNGDIGTQGDDQDNSFHVVMGSGTDASAVLDGFTVTGGDASEYPTQVDGAGMYIVAGTPTLANLVFLDNTALGQGGGLYNQSSHPTLTNVTFRGNFAAVSGGGLYNENSHPTLTHVSFSNNLAVAYGGGLDNSSSSPVLTDVVFEHDWSSYDEAAATKGFNAPENQSYQGGGMANRNGSSPVLTDVVFTDCYADDYGGGLYNENSDPILLRVTFSNNVAGSGEGGGFCNLSGSPSLTDVVFESNFAPLYGGGMSSRGEPTLTNVIFAGNNSGFAPFSSGGGGLANWGDAVLTNIAFIQNHSARHGGGLLNLDGNPVVTNATFAGNTAVDHGGAIADYGGSPALVNSILWNNAANVAGPEIYNDGSVPQIAYSLIKGSGGSGAGWDASLGIDLGHNLDADPLFVDPAAGNVRLDPGSPAVGAGDNAAVPPGVTIDLDGNPRIRGTTVDLGAYECQSVDETPPVLSIVLSRICLWPPNHKLVGIHAMISATDDADPAPACVLTSVVSNEPDASGEPGDIPLDIQGADFGGPDFDFTVRSERLGEGTGRIYTVTFTASDASGNSVNGTVDICVPHDQPGSILAATGFLPDGTGFLVKPTTFCLVIPSPTLSSGGAGPLFDPSLAQVGNTLAFIEPLSYRVLDVTGDAVNDLVLEYPTAAALQLAEISGPEGETLAFRYETLSSGGRLIPDIFALGTPVVMPPPSGTPEHIGGKTLTPAVESPSPTRAGFASIHPNPFRASTRVSFDLPAAGPVRLEVFDLRGACVRTLFRGETLAQGVHEATWDGLDDAGRPASTGIYFFRLVGEGVMQTRKATLMR